MAITSFSGAYRFLSNFYPALGLTLEHHFQAAKTDDPAQHARILSAKTPGEAKRLGRRATLRADWETRKDREMLYLLRMKFNEKALAKKLVETGDGELIEGNSWGDTYWGAVKSNGKWVGQNKLGRLLMQVRRELQGVE